MSRYSLVFLAFALTGCIGHGHEDRATREAQMQADVDAEAAACRCRFQVEDLLYDIPCGTTYCLGVSAMQCGAEGGLAQLDTECDDYDANELIPAVCQQDYPGEYPIDCASIADPEECNDYGGCVVEPAPCTEATFGCEGFITTP